MQNEKCHLLRLIIQGKIEGPGKQIISRLHNLSHWTGRTSVQFRTAINKIKWVDVIATILRG